MRFITIGAAILVMLLLISGAHWVVYHAVIRFFSLAGSILPLLRIIFLILGLSFVIMSVVTMIGYSRLSGWLYAVSAIWLGTVCWLFPASVIGLAVMGVGNLLLPGSPLPFFIGQALLLAGLLVSAYGLVHAEDTQVVHYIAQLPNLPPTWQGKNVVLVADMHFGDVRGSRFSRKLVKLIAAEQPEAVLIAGDFFDGPPVNFDRMAAPWKGLQAPRGVFFANGNHEEFRESSVYDNALRAVGIIVLNDELRLVDGLQIVGVNFGTSNTEADNAATLAKIGLDPARPSILVKHAPNALAASAAAGINLQVSGHTHKGQIWPGPWLTNKLFKGFAYGQHALGTLQVITTSGAGTWGPPQRVGTNGEIVVITLQ
jgi:predicted MPP superfamily phosphohydrolase